MIMPGDGFSSPVSRSGLRNRLRHGGHLAAFLAAAGVFAIGSIATISWLAMHGETTTQRRIATSPSVTVVIAKPRTPPPGSTVSRGAADTPSVTDAAAPASLLPVVPPHDTVSPETASAASPASTPQADTVPVQTRTPAELPAAPTSAVTASPGAETPVVPTPAPEEAATAPANPVPAWQAATRPFDRRDPRPRIALIVTDLGLGNGATKAAVQTLPAAVTLAFQAIAPAVDEWTQQARANGHEVLLAVPMEPGNYPQNDPGPQTLLTSLPAKANVQRLTTALARSPQILGIMPSQGDAFVQDETALAPVLDVLLQRQLVFVDGTRGAHDVAASLTAAGRIPYAQADTVIDATASRTAIDQALATLEARAKANGSAVGLALPYPVTFERLNDWIKTLPAKNIALAPLSAVLQNTASAPTAAPEPQAAAAKAVTPPLSATRTSAPTPAKSFGTIPRPKDDLSAIKRH